ncbi:MAG: hypothetical protein ABIL92_06470 [candidate division WOR-3 bacterium]
MRSKIKSYISLLVLLVFLISSGCQKALHEDIEKSGESETAKYVQMYLGDELILEIPESICDLVKSVDYEFTEIPDDGFKHINAKAISKRYSITIGKTIWNRMDKGEELRIGFLSKDFVEAYDYFLVYFNNNLKFPWIAKAVKGEGGYVYFKISPYLLKEVSGIKEADEIKISFGLVRNPDYESKAFSCKFYILKHQNGAFTMSENVTPPPPGQIPVVIIHGWQIPIWNNDLYSYAKGVSEEVVKYLTTMGLENKYEFYAYAYDPDYDLYGYSAYYLSQYINRYFASSDTVILIAHSMGGIVARVYAKYYKPSNKVIKRLITLGTPHHGTPFANLIFGGYVVPFVVPINPWLKWDNLYWTWAMYVHFYLFGGNPYLDALNSNYPGWSRVYAFVGYSISSKHPFYYVTGSGLLSFMGFGDSDGLVPLESANAYGYPLNRYYFYDTDHSELYYKINALSTIYNLLR